MDRVTDELVVRGGTVVDGTGSPGRRAEVLVRGSRIVEVSDKVDASAAARVLDATDCVVAPGFVNILSHAYISLQQDPRGLSDLYQGVTTEIFGEGISLGPVVGEMTEGMLGIAIRERGVDLAWPSLAGFLDKLADTGVGLNVGSLVGAANLRMSVAGLAARPLSPSELDQACALLDREMKQGALGVGAALIYPPGTYADFAELAAYCSVVARHDGVYAAHLRSEGDRLLESVGETIELARHAGVRAEVYHLKALGRDNWSKLPRALDLIEDARLEGLDITADIYPYAAGATGLAASIPPGFLEAGTAGLREALSSPAGRARVREQCSRGVDGWENLWELAGGPAGVVILSSVPELGIPAGSSVADLAVSRQQDPLDLLMDVLQARPETDAAYFMGNEENAKLAFERPWVCVGSDSEAAAVSDQLDARATHPRAYGAFARVLSSYVGPPGSVTLEECVRKMTSLPCKTLRLAHRGTVRAGNFADLAVFEPGRVRDTASYADPASYATGMRHVLVNGVPALHDNQPTGAPAGRALRARK